MEVSATGETKEQAGGTIIILQFILADLQAFAFIIVVFIPLIDHSHYIIM
jgi:hypothetical protein